jgi:DHA1 family bicyclomycin/chloramphenicol resistance-like MFS transporter
MTSAAVVGALVGYFHDGTSWPMAAIIGTTGLVAMAVYLLLLRDAGRVEPVS